MTEIEVAAELEYAMRRNGADGFAFETIAVSGDASSLPHGTPRNVKLKKGFLTMDFGAKYEGYCSDMTRTIVIGRADAEIKKLYNTVLEAQTRAIAYLRSGCDQGEADKVARDFIDSYPEFKGAFGHSLGHGVGLFIHENPRLSTKSFGKALRAGEVVTVEPGIYLYGKYGCRIEDMVKIEDGGVHNFTKSTKELLNCLRTGGVAVARVAGDRDGYVGVFSHGRHYITIVGEEPDGKLAILDPSLKKDKFLIEGRLGKVEIKNEVVVVCDVNVLKEDCLPHDPCYFLFWRG
jgi:hypothetical protein